MNDLEMLAKLQENPRRIALCTVGIYGESVKGHQDCCVVNSDNFFTWKGGFAISFMANSKRQWEIIEPPRKLKSFTLTDVILWGKQNPNKDVIINSCNRTYNNESFQLSCLGELSRKEILGAWTIEGIYEDEEDANEQ